MALPKGKIEYFLLFVNFIFYKGLSYKIEFGKNYVKNVKVLDRNYKP